MFDSTVWMYAFALLGGAVAIWRIWQNLNKVRRQHNDSWDARLIDQLRKRGSDPFKPHDVDFFLSLPSLEAADKLAGELRAEQFTTEVHEIKDATTLTHSLHAQKALRLSVPDMQDLSRRLTDAATALGGRYDGWSAKPVARDGPI